MPAMTEAAQVGKRQEIADKIFNIEAEATPILSMLKRGPTPNQMLATWQAEIFPDVPSTATPDNQAATAPDKIDRYLLQGYGHFFRRQWGVSTLADLTNIAGLSRNEAGHQLKNAMLLLKRMMEAQLLSADDTAADNGTTGFTLRGMLKWLENGEQAVLPVPASVRPASATNYTGAFASFTEASFKAIVDAAYQAKKSPVDWVGVLGSDLKAIFDDFTNVFNTETNTLAPRTIYKVQGNDKYSNMVDFVKFSTGSARLMLSEFVNRTTSTGAVGTYSRKSGLFIDPKQWDLCFMKNPANTNLAPDGSGKKGFIDAVAIVRCLNPLGQGSVVPTS
jgi:hypothetical protein